MKIVDPSKIAAGRHKNTKPASKASQSATQLVSNDNDIGVDFYDKAMIKVNRRLFKIIVVTNKYIEIFTFRENHLLVQIEIIKNCKIKIAIKSTAYTKLAIKFFKDGLWKKSKLMPKKFMELIKLFLAIKLTVSDIRNQ